MSASVEELTGLFRRLGARDPEQWAKSQCDEGINQLHRFLFLREAWARVVPDTDDSWIDHAIASAATSPDAPFAGIGLALGSLLEAGADRSDLVALVRGKQAEFLFDLTYLLGDPGLSEEGTQRVGWALVETDANGDPTGADIGCLHESVLETDPTGREMRPGEKA